MTILVRNLFEDGIGNGDGLSHPFGKRVLTAAIDTAGYVEARLAVRADSSGREGVEGLATVVASPIVADGRRRFAGGTRVSGSTWELGEL